MKRLAKIKCRKHRPLEQVNYALEKINKIEGPILLWLHLWGLVNL